MSKGKRLRSLSLGFPFSRRRDPDEFGLNFSMDGVENAIKASAIIVHTFDTL
jgi:hypothetical protein